MKLAYPIILTPHNNEFVVYVPDLEINTQGKDIANAIEMARDAIGMWACYEQDEKRQVPMPSKFEAIKHSENEIISFVDIDFDEYRRKHDNRTIRKNLTIPSWLNEEAEKQHINFSKILQEALIDKLHLPVK